MFGAYAFAAGYFAQGPVITIVVSGPGDVIRLQAHFRRQVELELNIRRTVAAKVNIRTRVDLEVDR